MNVSQPKLLRILFDEFHSESWSASASRALEMQPEDPANASYALAANALATRDFEVLRNVDQVLEAGLLATTDVVALIHPCDPKWEHTTSRFSPRLSEPELQALLAFVAGGGGLMVVAEYEHDKYGNNLNDLLGHFGLRIVNGKVFDRTHCLHENPEWVLGTATEASPLGHLASQACFYRAGWCETLQGPEETKTEAQIVWAASPEAHPSHAGLIATARYGEGRVALVTDSNLFGDERLGHFDHLQLWINMAYWLAAPGLGKRVPVYTPVPVAMGHNVLLEATNALRALQQADGSVLPANHLSARALVDAITHAIKPLAPSFPHQSEYFGALASDFKGWIQAGFTRPDFAASLAAFHPERQRIDGLEHWVLFPMYTPNASSHIRFEALLMRTPWPKWLAELEHQRYRNPKFVPGHLVAYTQGYDSECAVLFPETVSIKTRASNDFGVIFCDREALRFQNCLARSARILGMPLHPELEAFLGSKTLVLNTMALWDLIHDASHSLGELPFDPFMIRQRAPFWMYALEELRVDLRSFEQARQLAAEGFHSARYVCWTMVLDRILRFPVTGSRVRNYDALGGQLLFAFLHQRDVAVWRDNRLSLRWECLSEAITDLRHQVTALYKEGANCSKVGFWIAAHDLVSRYLRPNVASQWKVDSRKLVDETDPKAWIASVHDDEFPLGSFHLNLQRKLATFSREEG